LNRESLSELLLRRAGASHFVIPDLFDVGLLPAAAGKVSFATAASAATNESLDELLAIEQCVEGVNIIRLNVFSLLNAVETAPTHFGFTDFTNPCLTPAVCADPDHTFFWDTHHQTGFRHAFFAVTMENALPKRHD
jgi:phospholipase/lecithinase/hemolysin